MERDNSANVVWFLTGAALGAAIALLYAPQSGADTRRYLGRKARKGREALNDVSEDLMEKGRELYDQGRRVAEEAGDLFDRGRRIIEG